MKNNTNTPSESNFETKVRDLSIIVDAIKNAKVSPLALSLQIDLVKFATNYQEKNIVSAQKQEQSSDDTVPKDSSLINNKQKLIHIKDNVFIKAPKELSDKEKSLNDLSAKEKFLNQDPFVSLAEGPSPTLPGAEVPEFQRNSILETFFKEHSIPTFRSEVVRILGKGTKSKKNKISTKAKPKKKAKSSKKPVSVN